MAAPTTPKQRAEARKDKLPPKVFDPLFDDLVIHIFDEAEVQSGGGIHIPGKSKDTWANLIGYVIAKGPEVKYITEGDLVIIKEAHLTEMGGQLVPSDKPQVRYNNVTYHLIPEWMIAGKLI